MPFDEFLKEFGAFRFSFSYNGGTFDKDFSEEEVTAIINRRYSAIKKFVDAQQARYKAHAPAVIVKE
jgi:hypothetical protein